LKNLTLAEKKLLGRLQLAEQDFYKLEKVEGKNDGAKNTFSNAVSAIVSNLDGWDEEEDLSDVVNSVNARFTDE
jgi:hypothetical protein